MDFRISIFLFKDSKSLPKIPREEFLLYLITKCVSLNTVRNTTQKSKKVKQAYNFNNCSK